MEINQIFRTENYDDACNFCAKNNCTIREIESDELGRRFQIIEIPAPTQKQLAEYEIEELKQKLLDTDYRAIKYAEGLLSAEEYESTKIQRQAWRERINQLENLI